MSFQTSALILTWAALALLSFVVAGLVRQVHALSSGGVRQAPAGLRAGDPAAGLDALGADAPAVLLFLRATCSTCDEVLAETAAEVGGRIPVFALYEGSAPAPPAGVVAAGEQTRLFTAYGALATPFAVLVGQEGRITAATPVGSRDAVRHLLAAVRTA